ncbi:MAG: N-acetylmuramoyl-L-alanine amidase [Lachnospiraceae bacterium]|nr:N-acetylmuramoyl-L-alanine amidase [Lachnospiraceae bacterium]
MYRKTKLFMAVILICSAFFMGKTLSVCVSGNHIEKGKKLVVLDAGHGSSDPGKIGVNGKKEKDVNLSIAKKVEKKLKKQNIAVKMTRREDKGLDNTKIGDMKARVNMINGTKPALAVSIHQNSYTQEEIKGAQVFYFTHSKDGKEAAEVMQEMFRLFDKENKRVCKGNNTYYMLKKTEVPTIIVECGFLSNWEEAKKLSTKEYQEKVAQVICDGIIHILQKQGE